jgi:hypothetical protein
MAEPTIYPPKSVGLRIWLNYTCDSLALAVNKEEHMGVNRFLIRQNFADL